VKRAALALLLLAACGDGSSNPPDDPDANPPDDEPDAMNDPEPDAMPDPPDPTFTSFVIDQITSHTNATSDPVPFSDVTPLPDPDTDNPDAYDSLF
jgi:hypothetical protein